MYAEVATHCTQPRFCTDERQKSRRRSPQLSRVATVSQCIFSHRKIHSLAGIENSLFTVSNTGQHCRDIREGAPTLCKRARESLSKKYPGGANPQRHSGPGTRIVRYREHPRQDTANRTQESAPRHHTHTRPRVSPLTCT